jgi:hypothetical protein
MRLGGKLPDAATAWYVSGLQVGAPNMVGRLDGSYYFPEISHPLRTSPGEDIHYLIIK